MTIGTAEAESLQRPQGTAIELNSQIKPRSLWGDAVRRFLADRLAVAGLILTTLFIFMGIFGPIIAPYDHLTQDLDRASELPSHDHLLGTDHLGRDMLSRILYGARTAVTVALVVTVLSLILGVMFGAIAGYLGGIVDTVFLWLTDIVMNIPALLLAVLIDYSAKKPISDWMERMYQQTRWEPFNNSIYGSYMVVFVSLAFIFWPHYARLIRGQILSLREQEYVLAARAVGVPIKRLLINHLVPNALGPVIVAAALGACDNIVLESSLSFLGVGIQPPGASWGSMINSSIQRWTYRPHLVIVPGIVLAISALGLAFLGNGLSDALDPRRREKQ